MGCCGRKKVSSKLKQADVATMTPLHAKLYIYFYYVKRNGKKNVMVAKQYAVCNVKMKQYAVRNINMKQYARGRGFHPLL